MSLYEYQCEVCGLKFEELKSNKEDSSVVSCKNCGGNANKLMSAFAPVVAGGTPVESIDLSVGREANRMWQTYYDRQSKRRGDRELQSFKLPQAKDGKYMPVMALGDKQTVEKRQDYVGALQEHRKDRAEKGIAQFKESGEF